MGMDMPPPHPLSFINSHSIVLFTSTKCKNKLKIVWEENLTLKENLLRKKSNYLLVSFHRHQAVMLLTGSIWWISVVELGQYSIGRQLKRHYVFWPNALNLPNKCAANTQRVFLLLVFNVLAPPSDFVLAPPGLRRMLYAFGGGGHWTNSSITLARLLGGNL